MLDKYQSILPLIDRLIISLDSAVPEKWHKIIGVPVAAAERIIRNIQDTAQLQSIDKFTLVLNCVVTPETISDARKVLEFSEATGTYVSFSPQAVHNWPHYDLLVSEPYRKFITDLISKKRSGAPIFGSLKYLESIHDFTEYRCYPTLAPRIMPNGDLIYPCRPVEKEGDSFGGRLNLLQVDHWEEAMDQLSRIYGDPPISCTSCFQQCYIEPSLMQAQPGSFFKEWALYPPSRKGKILNHTPG
ncbi:MAG: hypothetical protein P8Y68_20720 [Anaerolineales bacterium]